MPRLSERRSHCASWQLYISHPRPFCPPHNGYKIGCVKLLVFFSFLRVCHLPISSWAAPRLRLGLSCPGMHHTYPFQRQKFSLSPSKNTPREKSNADPRKVLGFELFVSRNNPRELRLKKRDLLSSVLEVGGKDAVIDILRPQKS